MSEHPSAQLIRRFLAAFSTPNYEAVVRELLTENVKWHVAGASPLAGDFVGTSAVLRAMRQFGARSRHTLRLETQSVFADDAHVIAVHVATGQRGDLSYEAHEIDVFHIRDDHIAEFWSFSEDQRATDAFWSGGLTSRA